MEREFSACPEPRGGQWGGVRWGRVEITPLAALNSAPRGPGCFFHLDQETCSATRCVTGEVGLLLFPGWVYHLQEEGTGLLQLPPSVPYLRSLTGVTGEEGPIAITMFQVIAGNSLYTTCCGCPGQPDLMFPCLGLGVLQSIVLTDAVSCGPFGPVLWLAGTCPFDE